MNELLEKRIIAFLSGERAEKDTIAVKKIYVDLAGSLAGGVILGQILYWHGGRLRVQKHGHFWLAKQYKDWWDEVRVKEKTAQRVIEKLVERGYIEKRVHRFGGLATTHLRVIWENFLDAYDNALKAMYSKSVVDEDFRFGQNDQFGGNGQNDQTGNGQNDQTLNRDYVTETTLSDTTNNNNGFSTFDKMKNDMRSFIICQKCGKDILPEHSEMNCHGH
jgi:hypothetical protein